MAKLRLDRALSVGLAKPFMHFTNARRQHRIPILMYHGIRDGAGVGARHRYFETNTPPQVFSRHMRFLRESGYTVATLSDALQSFPAACAGQKLVALTFDDGYLDFYTQAFPVLAQFGFGATVFVVSGFAGKERPLSSAGEYMNWGQVRELHAYGIEIGSHTATHPELQTLSSDRINAELGRSKETIEEEVGEPIQSFSYPFALPEHNKWFITRLRSVLEAHGYRYGVTTMIGRAGRRHDRFFLPRLPVNAHDDLRLFEAKLEGAYDWLHGAQALYKRLLKPTPVTPRTSGVVAQI